VLDIGNLTIAFAREDDDDDPAGRRMEEVGEPSAEGESQAQERAPGNEAYDDETTPEVLAAIDVEKKLYQFVFSEGFLCNDKCKLWSTAFIELALANAQSFASLVGGKLAEAALPAGTQLPPLVTAGDKLALTQSLTECGCNGFNAGILFDKLKASIVDLASPSATLGDVYEMTKGYIVTMYSKEDGQCTPKCVASGNAEGAVAMRLYMLAPLGYVAGLFSPGGGLHLQPSANGDTHLTVTLGTPPERPALFDREKAHFVAASNALVEAARSVGSCMCDLNISKLMDDVTHDPNDDYPEFCYEMPLQCADCGQYIICTDPACQHGGRCNGVVCSEGAYCAPCTQYTACDPWEGVKPGAVLTLANRVVSDHTCESESCQRSFDKMYEGVNNSLRAHPDCTMESLVLCKGRCLPCIDNEDFDVEGVACDDFCGPACGNTGVAYGLADEALFWGTCLMSQTCPPIDVSHYTLSTKLDVINAAGTPAPSASELASALSRLFGIAQDDVAAHDDVADQSGQLPSGKYDLAVTFNNEIEKALALDILHKLDGSPSSAATKLAELLGLPGTGFMVRGTKVESIARNTAPPADGDEDGGGGGGALAVFGILLLLAILGGIGFAVRKYADKKWSIPRAFAPRRMIDARTTEVAPSNLAEQGAGAAVATGYVAPQIITSSTNPPGSEDAASSGAAPAVLPAMD